MMLTKSHLDEAARQLSKQQVSGVKVGDLIGVPLGEFGDELTEGCTITLEDGTVLVVRKMNAK